MSLVQHLIDLILFLTLVVGPIPLCLSLVALVEDRKEAPSLDSTSARGTSLAHCLLLLLTSWCVIETCLAVILGIAHSFALGPVLLSESVVFSVGILLLMRGRGIPRLVALLGRMAITKPFNSFEKMVAGTIALVMAFAVLIVILEPTTNYDSLRYHLPSMVYWYQTSSLDVSEEFRFLQIGRYPNSWEALCALFIMPFREDFVVALPNVVAWLILGVSVYLLSAHLGAARIHSLAASCLTLTLPIVLEHVGTLHVDLPLVSFFIAALYFSVLYVRTRQPAYLAILLAILGMLLGIKIPGIVYGGILAAFVISSVITGRITQRRPLQPASKLNRSVGVIFAAGMLCFLVTGCYWYLRNCIEVHNPLGYVKLNIGSINLLPGAIEPAELRRGTLVNVFKVTNLSDWKILIDQILARLSVPFLVMLLQLIAALFLLPFTGRLAGGEPVRQGSGEHRIRRKHFIGLVALLAGTVLLYWNSPYTGDDGGRNWQLTPWFGHGIRYGFPMLGVLGVVAALSATLTKTKESVIASIVIVCGLLSVTSTPYERMATVFVCCAVGFLVVWSLLKSVSWTRLILRVRGLPKLGLCSLLIGLIFAFSFVARGIRDRHRSREYNGILEYIESNIPQDQTIGYLLSHRPYLMYGKHFNRKVAYVPAGSSDESEWLDALEKRKVSFVAIGPILDEWRSQRELSWIRNNDKGFVHVFGQDSSRETFIYRFNGHE
jgi:hypothetical protein